MLRLVFAMGLVAISVWPALADDPTSPRTPDVVFVPTPGDVVTKMLEVANVTKDDVVCDLGCGDGRIVVTAAKRFGCRGVGYDLNPVRVRESRENARRNGVEKRVTIQRKDIFTVDLSEASVVTLYLLPSMNLRLVPQLQQLKPGARIVAHDFGIEGYPPDKEVKMTSREDAVEHTIYLWVAPLKKEES